ncbi:conjugative transposon protein TraN [Algoriphagus sp. PAP.12]|uniref:conjugative transposon protein TraN n=1 Tax=Algoriphagus sp. PAP.12 TaxID=2996678 RepID=UPI00227CADB9|nr:conjugative transposon protein TraN [Algoriphagus sp. PAP.12]
MKTIRLIMLLITCCIYPKLITAQQNYQIQTRSIPSSKIQISEQMTTNLIFPHAIKSVDRGNRSILVQKAKETENILQVKAESKALPNSNLTVITEEGGFYSFRVEYQAIPQALNLKIHPNINEVRVNLESSIPTKPQLETTAKAVSLKNKSIQGVRQHRFLTGMILEGIYIEKDLLYFQIRLQNQTNIPYDIDQFRLFIRDNKQSKRTASQELEQIPILIYGNAQRIPAQSAQTLVVALPKFTIPDQKHLKIDLMETNGGRHLHFKVKNKHLMEAKILH